MNEAKIIESTPFPCSRRSLTEDLRKLGVKEGMTLIVHSSLSSLGWVCGGPVAVVQAIMDAVTDSGTIVMPAHSGAYSEPSYWGNPPVPQGWWQEIRDTMPAFEPQIAPTRGIGTIAECFRNFPGVLRSSHPTVSFTSWGKNAAYITANHSIDFSLGNNSPLARLYELDGWVLMLGTGYNTNTSFHLGEYRATGAKAFIAGAPIIENGQRVWKEYDEIEFDTDVFPEIGADFENNHHVIKGLVGSARTRLFKQRAAVDFAGQWISARRNRDNSL